MDTEDYRRTSATSTVPISGPVPSTAAWDPQLRTAMEDGMAGFEEADIDRILAVRPNQ